MRFLLASCRRITNSFGANSCMLLAGKRPVVAAFFLKAAALPVQYLFIFTHDCNSSLREMAAHFCAPADKRSGRRRDLFSPIFGPVYLLCLTPLWLIHVKNTCIRNLDSHSHKCLDPVSLQKLQQVLPLWDAPQDGRPFFLSTFAAASAARCCCCCCYLQLRYIGKATEVFLCRNWPQVGKHSSFPCLQEEG